MVQSNNSAQSKDPSIHSAETLSDQLPASLEDQAMKLSLTSDQSRVTHKEVGSGSHEDGGSDFILIHEPTTPSDAGSDKTMGSEESPAWKSSPISDLTNESPDSYKQVCFSSSRNGQFDSDRVSSNSPMAFQESPLLKFPRASTQTYGSPDTYKQVCSSPSRNRSPVQFDSSLEVSPSTFRDLYNATPEPIDQGSDSKENHSARQAVVREYNANDEKLPDGPYFDRSFQEAIKKGKHTAGLIEDTLRTCELSSDSQSQVHKLVDTASQLRNFQASSVCTIGIVGDSGVGKSSLVNSLLNRDIAGTAGLGKACTSVVTEYRLRKPEHTAEYNIEIDYMTGDEIDELLRELLWSYRLYHLGDIRQNGTEGEREKSEKKSKVAWDTLQAAFAPGSNGELAAEFLLDNSEGAEKRIQQQLKSQLESWTDKHWHASEERHGWSSDAGDVVECKNIIRNFLNTHPWPFVKVIRIYLSSQVLKSGAVLADLPGFHDANHARVKAAQDYIYHCEEMFVVANINRVTTNKSVEDILERTFGRNLANARPSQGISLICTKSEDLDNEEIKKELSDECLDLGRVASLEKVIRVKDAEAEDLVPGALRSLREAQEQLECLYITARNEHIKKLVLEKHKRRFEGKELSVFCVSNKMYKKYREYADKHKLYMETTGIPAVRKICHTIPARTQFRIAEHYLNVRLKDLIQSVQLWIAGASSTFNNDDDDVRLLLDTLIHNMHENLNVSRGKFKAKNSAALTKIIEKRMKIDTPAWTNKALRKCGLMDGYHHSTLAAVCRNYGSYSTKAPVPPELKNANWNREFVAPMIDGLSDSWMKLGEMCDEAFDYVHASVVQELLELTSDVNSLNGAQLFVQTIETKIEEINYIASIIKTEFEYEFKVIRHYATGDHEGSYIFEEMLPTWRDCVYDSGQGVQRRRLARIQNAICTAQHPVLFPALRKRLVTALDCLFEETCSKFQDRLSRVLRNVSEDLEMVRTGEANKPVADRDTFLDSLKSVASAAWLEWEDINSTVILGKELGAGQFNRLNE